MGTDLAARLPGADLLDGPAQIVVESEFRSVTVQVSGSVSLTLLGLGVDSGRIGITASATSRPHLVE